MLRKISSALLLFGAALAFGQGTVHTVPNTDSANVFINTNQFTLGITVGPILFANLGTVSTATTLIYVSDASPSNPCTGGGTGALAIRQNGAWNCTGGGGGGGGGPTLGSAGQVAVMNQAASAYTPQTKAELDVRDVPGVVPAGNTSCNRNVTMSGCVDSYTALQAFITAQCPGSTYSPGPTIVLPQNTNIAQGIDYYSSQPLLLPRGCHLKGTGTGRVGRATTIAFASGKAGFVCQSGCVIEHFFLLGGNTYTSGTIPTIANADGIQAGSSTIIDDVLIQGFGRHGLMAASDLGSGLPGWPTQFDAVTTIGVVSNDNLGDGFHFSGGDGGTGTEIDAEAYSNQGTGIVDTSLYGNAWVFALTTGNGRSYNSTNGKFSPAPYSESDVLGGNFCNGGVCASLYNPTGATAPLSTNGVIEDSENWHKRFYNSVFVIPTRSAVMDQSSDAANVATALSYDPDFFGQAAFTAFNINPTNPNTVIDGSVIYSSLLLRRNFSGSGNNAKGNASNWWSWLIPGNPDTANGNMPTTDIALADDLTDPLRSNLKGKGGSWFPNFFCFGIPPSPGNFTPANCFASGTAAPTTGSWLLGDFTINNAPVAQGAPFGYRNYSAGTPGSWETLNFDVPVNPLAFSGADACAQIAAAGQSLNGNARGGTVDARRYTGTQACASNPFAGVTVPVRFLFGGATWNTTAQWNLCNGCRAEGSQWSSTVVVAVTGFSTAGQAIANIGDGTNTFFDTRFEHFQFDCGNTAIANCYGFQGQGIDEGSGLSFVRIRNCNAANAGGCVKVNSAPSTSNYTMDHVYVLFNTSASTTADGVLVSGTSSQGTWDALTVIGAGVGTTGHAFHCAGTFTGCKVRSLHFESMSDGAYWNSTSWGYLHGATGDPTNNSGAAVLHINTTSASYAIDYADLMSVNTTYILKNDVTGESISGTTNSGNVSLAHGSYPSQAVDTLTDSSGNPFIKVSPTASAVDGVTVTNAATGSPATVSIAATGSDTNININLVSKGSGTVQCNGSTCGGGGSSAGSQYAVQYNSNGSGGFAGTTPPTTNGSYLCGYSVTASAAVAPGCPQVGIGGRALTGAATTDTVLYSDVNQVIDHDQGASAGVTETIPTPATLNNTSFGFIYWNHSAQTDTLKATTNTIQAGSAAAVAGSTGVSIGPGQIASVKQDPNLSTQWLVNIVDQGGYINGTAFSGTSGDVVKFGAGNTPGDAGFLATNVVRKDAANTGAAAMTLDMSAATGATAFKVPVIAGATAGADGVIDYDSTGKITHIRTNGADSDAAATTSTSTTTTQALFATAVAGIYNPRAIAVGDLPGSGATTVNGQTCTLNSTCTVNPPLDKSTNGLANPTADATFTYPSTSTTGLTLAGTAPASVSTSTGTNGSSVLVVTAPVGGADSNATGTAGVGGSPSVTAGNGGAGTGTNTVGGAGGSVSFTAGAGGASAGTGANSNGGSITLTPGAAGTGGSGAAGKTGNVNVAAGNLNVGTAQCVTFGTAGGICPAEGTAPTNVSGAAPLYPDSTAHEYIALTNGSSLGGGILNRTQPAPANETGKTATDSAKAICTASAGGCNVAGQYHVFLNVWGSGTACSSVTAGSVVFTITWVDEQGTTHTSVPMAPFYDFKSAAVNATGTFNFNTSLATEGATVDMTLSTNGSAAPTVTGTYTACTTGTGTYNFRATMSRLQ